MISKLLTSGYFKSRYVWVLPLLSWLALICVSLFWNYRLIEDNVFETATNRGRYMFRVLELTRLWNAQHGGVYVPVSDLGQPNPYLEDDPDRDLITDSGKQLTKINPAYMTRQISQLAFEKGIYFHITSLKPIRPANAADPWETSALRAFEQGQPERIELIKQQGLRLFRYMAPLIMHQACLQCHEKQGYRVGDIRGGISVSMDAAPFLAGKQSMENLVFYLHMAVFILVGSMLVMFLRINRKNLLLFENASELQEQLIQQRTEELSQANELLQSEIGERNNSNRALRESEQYLQEITAALGEGLFVTDLNGVITYANPAVSQLLGWQEVELLGRCSHELLHHHTRDGEPFPKEDCHIMRAMKQGETIDKQEECFWTKKGGPLPIEVISTPIIRDDFVYGSVVAFRDITDSLDAQEALRQSEGRLRGIMDVLPDLMFLVDERGEIIEILTGVDFLMEIGSTYPFAMNIFDAFPAAPAGQLKKVIDDTIAVGKPQLIEYKEHKYAKDRWFEGRTALTGLTIDDNKAVVFIARDITEKKSAQEELQRLNRELEYQARSDPLTGTANRRYIMEQGKRLSSLVKRNGGDLSIIIFDLDGFKSVNDKYGHDIGDRVLKTVADKVEQGIREIDILGRWGGEEFIILCQQTNLAEAVHLAGRLRKILDMSIIDPIGKMTASFGVAASHGNESLEQTIHRADQALYAAKHAGRNRVFSNNRGQNELLSA